MHSTTTKSARPHLACLLVLAACAEGGTEERPQSDVLVTASHHLHGFRSLRGFGTFPVIPEVVFTDRGTLNLFDDSTYTITRTSGTTGADRYALETTGALSLLITGGGSEPSVVFTGGYSLVNGVAASNSALFFTDRVSTPSSESLGLYVGTRIVQGQVELEGAWHVLSLHTVFGQALQSPDNVARGARGAVSIAAGAPGTSRSISGSGTQGTSGLVFGGTIQNLLPNGGGTSGDGTCNLTISYTVTGQSADNRVVNAVATPNLVLGLDDDESDGEAGLLLLVKKFAPAAPVDPVRVVDGRFLVGGHTIFVNPTNCGSDAFVGVVTLTAQGAFRLDAVGNQGADFSYVGTYTLNTDGGLTITLPATNETWFGAIDLSYQTLTIVDDFVETRANNIPELNLVLGVRENT